MKNKAIIATGSNGYILKDFNFSKFKDEFEIFYVHNNCNELLKNHFDYNNLFNLLKTLKKKKISSIVLISFGSHLGGHDPNLYFNAVRNLEKLLIVLNSFEGHTYIYHAASFSTFNPIINSSLLPLFIEFSPDLRGPYAFSKYKQDQLISKFSSFNKKFYSKLVFLGHVYSKENELSTRFNAKSIRLGRLIISFLYSPFKLINPTSKKSIHKDIEFYLNNYNSYRNQNEILYLTDKGSPSTIFNIFLKEKKFFISPIAPIISTLIAIFFKFTRKNSLLRYYFIKYLQMNNSIRI